MRLNLAWFHHNYSSDDSRARGYLKAAFQLYERLKVLNDGLMDMGRANYRKKHWKRAKVDAVLHVTPTHLFERYERATNIALSMWEGPKLPDMELSKIRKADLHLVPSTYCQETWRRSGLTAGVVPFGVSNEILQTNPTRQIIRGKATPRLRFLYVGSNDARKGWMLLAPAFKAAFENYPKALPHVQLYIKTLVPGNDGIAKPYQDDRLVLDFRKLSDQEMADLYQSADVFVFPSFAEGFGLPPLEAMAAGALCVAPETGGMTDFVNVRTACVLPKSGVEEFTYGMKWRDNVPTVHDLAKCFRATYDLWGTAPTEAIRKHGTNVARSFTWDNSARILYETISGALKQRGAA